MGRPTEEQLDTALAEAARLREQGEDNFFVGKSLMNLNYRVDSLEHVLEKAKRYLHSGLGPYEQTELIKAIEIAEKAAEHIYEDNEGFTAL